MRLPLVMALISLCGCKAEKTSEPATPAPRGPSLPVPAVPAVSKWALDPENSSVSFSCKHVFTNVRGLFKQPTGTLTIDEATLANSKVEASVDVNSITTGVDERDSHLKSADFFETSKFPAATFTSTSIKGSNGALEVTGTLSMHGISKPVTLSATLSPPFNHAGGIRRAIAASGSVNRRDFGILWDFPGEGSGVVVGDVIQLGIDAELVLQP
ncbi:MAG: YceI family protein [Archangium sp.]